MLSGGIHGHTSGGSAGSQLQLQPARDNGSVVQIANLRDSTRTVNYTYDQLNRLSSAQTTAANWGDSYTYDNWGNLLAKTVINGSGESLAALTVDSENHIVGFGYDLAGNMLNDGVNSMTYDAENRRNPTSGTTFTYDGDGRRVAKSDGTVYWVDDNFRPLSLGTNTGSITKDFVFLGSKRIAFVALSSGNPYYYLSDHLGSTAVIGSGDGKVIEWEADYSPLATSARFLPIWSATLTNSPGMSTIQAAG
jgi:YD repeat-containing protein